MKAYYGFMLIIPIVLLIPHFSALAVREQNCYTCFNYGKDYFYCKIGNGLGTCCDPNSISNNSECNYL